MLSGNIWFSSENECESNLYNIQINDKQRRTSTSSSGLSIHLLMCSPDLEATRGRDELPHGMRGIAVGQINTPILLWELRTHVLGSK